MSLAHVKRTFEAAGRDDPMYAVFTDHRRRGGRWDPAEFFAHGKGEVDHVMAYVRSLSPAQRTADVLDFGCGVGRLTQALANYFDQAVGVDISSSMLEAAERFNAHGSRVRYVVNDQAHLKQFGDASFDFIYSNITLQHVPPAPALAYVREFVRILRPGGLAVFQLGIGPLIQPGSVASFLYTVRREYLRRFWKRIRGRIPYEMHFVAESQVLDAVSQAGGTVVDTVDVSRVQNRGSLRFAVTKAA
jgi:SAM-dependent methyltransferase